MQRIKIEFAADRELRFHVRRRIHRPVPHRLGTIQRPGVPAPNAEPADRAPRPVRSSVTADRLYAAWSSHHRVFIQAVLDKMNLIPE